MLKRFSVLVMVMVSLLGIVPVFAQDATIADIVVASSEAETPEFGTLLAAIQSADPSVLETLSDPNQTLTVFAPTDAAFEVLLEAVGEEAFVALLTDTELLTSILLYHVVPFRVMSTDVMSTVELYEGRFAGVTLNGQYIEITLTEDGGLMLDNANLILEMVDIEASNGVIHVIDAVLLPETRTIAEIVVANTEAETPEFTTLLTAVAAADGSILEALSDPDAELTVFAPTDAAFTALGEGMLEGVIADQALLTGILTYHVVPGVAHSGDIANIINLLAGGSVTEDMLMEEDTLSEIPWFGGAADEGGGIQLITALSDANVTAVLNIEERKIVINGATIVINDIDAGNGVIHVIDAVLLPN